MATDLQAQLFTRVKERLLAVPGTQPLTSIADIACLLPAATDVSEKTIGMWAKLSADPLHIDDGGLRVLFPSLRESRKTSKAVSASTGILYIRSIELSKTEMLLFLDNLAPHHRALPRVQSWMTSLRNSDDVNVFIRYSGQSLGHTGYFRADADLKGRYFGGLAQKFWGFLRYRYPDRQIKVYEIDAAAVDTLEVGLDRLDLLEQTLVALLEQSCLNMQIGGRNLVFECNPDLLEAFSLAGKTSVVDSFGRAPGTKTTDVPRVRTRTTLETSATDCGNTDNPRVRTRTTLETSAPDYDNTDDPRVRIRTPSATSATEYADAIKALANGTNGTNGTNRTEIPREAYDNIVHQADALLVYGYSICFMVGSDPTRDSFTKGTRFLERGYATSDFVVKVLDAFALHEDPAATSFSGMRTELRGVGFFDIYPWPEKIVRLLPSLLVEHSKLIEAKRPLIMVTYGEMVTQISRTGFRKAPGVPQRAFNEKIGMAQICQAGEHTFISIRCYHPGAIEHSGNNEQQAAIAAVATLTLAKAYLAMDIAFKCLTTSSTQPTESLISAILDELVRRSVAIDSKLVTAKEILAALRARVTKNEKKRNVRDDANALALPLPFPCTEASKVKQYLGSSRSWLLKRFVLDTYPSSSVRGQKAQNLEAARTIEIRLRDPDLVAESLWGHLERFIALPAQAALTSTHWLRDNYSYRGIKEHKSPAAADKNLSILAFLTALLPGSTIGDGTRSPGARNLKDRDVHRYKVVNVPVEDIRALEAAEEVEEKNVPIQDIRALGAAVLEEEEEEQSPLAPSSKRRRRRAPEAAGEEEEEDEPILTASSKRRRR